MAGEERKKKKGVGMLYESHGKEGEQERREGFLILM